MAGRDSYFTPTQLSAMLLSHLLALAAEQLPRAATHVITVPARFSQAQRQATLQAAHMAGIHATLLQGACSGRADGLNLLRVPLLPLHILMWLLHP